MKDQFKGFYSLDEDEYIELWNNATFILDTNVLLNLYRYREDTTEQLIKV
ncbi:PIN-like domain-containing protein, partial [Vibrio parahaemolyticus]